MDLPPNEIHCLELAVQHETTGKIMHGADKVAMVVINRANSSKFPNTVCEVVYQKHQFTDIRKTKHASNKTKQIVAKVLNNPKEIDTKLLFFHSSNRPSSWKKLTFVYQIGSHRFYTEE